MSKLTLSVYYNILHSGLRLLPARQCLAKSPFAFRACLAVRDAGFLYVLPLLGWHVPQISFILVIIRL